jgi:hypothetical protein
MRAPARRSFCRRARALWFNEDPHYDLENGISCRECGHALSWPRVEKQ